MENTNLQPTPIISTPIESTPITPVDDSSSPNNSNKSKLLFIGIALILFGILLGVLVSRYLPMSGAAVTPTPTITIEPTETLTPTPVVDLTAGWETFYDDLEKISFKYPKHYTIETRPGDSGGVVSYLFAKEYLITLDVFSKYTPKQVEFYYDTPSNGKMDIGGNLWSTYYLPTGYGDGGVEGSGQPIFGLQTELNKHLLRVTLINQKTIAEEQKQILSTFKFNVELATISAKQLSAGWYYGSKEQRLSGTPTSWIYKDGGRSSCWHKPGVECVTGNTSYTCPSNGWVDCMPSTDSDKTTACSTEAMSWYKTNCPNFQGSAL